MVNATVIVTYGVILGFAYIAPIAIVLCCFAYRPTCTCCGEDDDYVLLAV